MARKNKIESSDHFDEIVKRLSEGETGASVSAWLENTYNEKISVRTLNRYKRNINMPKRVEAELNKRAKKKPKKKTKPKTKKPNKKVEAQIEKGVQHQADKKEAAEENIMSVAETIADNMQGVAKVAAELPKMFERTKSQAADPEVANVTFKDAANIAIQANRLYAEYFKQEENNVEININAGFGELADAIRKSREKFQD